MDMGMIFYMMLLVHSFTWLVFAGAGQNECTVTRCDNYGPIIRFPFRTKDQPEHCGYPGFELYCDIDEANFTVLEFQYQANTSLRGLQLSFSQKLYVQSIDYKLQRIDGYSLRVGTKLQQLLNPQNSTPFKVEESSFEDRMNVNQSEFTFLNCTATSSIDMIFRMAALEQKDIYLGTVAINENADFGGLLAINSGIKTFEAPLKSCTKMFNVSLVAHQFIPIDEVLITWATPNCGHCEATGQNCELKNNSSSTGTKHDEATTVCFPKGHGQANKAILGGKIGGLIFVLLLLVALYYVIKTYKQKKEDQLNIEIFLADYKALKPTRYSYANIRKITNQFKEKLGQGGYGSVYKGQLSSDVLVAVKVLNYADPKGNGEEFINEVSTIGLIHHVNVIRLVGYCADGSNRALVYEFLPNNSLEKFVCLGRNHNSRFLGWEKLQQIALGIAKGIEYLHQGCAQKILHLDIKPHNILLDQNLNPKISDFGLAKLCSKGQSIVSMTMAKGTIGYIAPEVFSRNFGKVSSKSDVYSFGMLLLELVGAKNNTVVGTEKSDETYFPEWIFHRLEQGGELTIQIEDEVDNNIARKLTIVGLWCIGWHPVDRPSMKHVIQMLEGEDCPAIPPNPFSSTSSRNATAITHARPFTKELEAISESE